VISAYIRFKGEGPCSIELVVNGWFELASDAASWKNDESLAQVFSRLFALNFRINARVTGPRKFFSTNQYPCISLKLRSLVACLWPMIYAFPRKWDPRDAIKPLTAVI
jgi:hypothetical protein